MPYTNSEPGLFKFIVISLFLALVIVSVSNSAFAASAEMGPKCSDGIDNDEDGLVGLDGYISALAILYNAPSLPNRTD
jgi:hypothetical protein